MGNSLAYIADLQTVNDKNFPQVLTAEDVLKIVLEAYTLATDPLRDFLCKKKDLFCLYKKYQCLIDNYRPHFFLFKKDAFGYQILILIARVQDFDINLVTYQNLCGWTVLPGSPVKRWSDDCNKLQYVVCKSKGCTADEIAKYEIKKGEIQDMCFNCTFDYSPDTIIDYRNKPGIDIVEPCNKSNVSCEFWLKANTCNWRLQDHGKNYRVYVDGCEQEIVYTEDPVLIRLHGQCKGWKTISVKLFDECGRYANVKQSVRVNLCESCKCDGYAESSCSSSSSSSSCDSSSSSSDDCGCGKKKCKKCCSSSSSSSSSVCGCDSSSSSSSSSECCKKKKKKKCCDSSSSSSSSCSSSSSSSDEEDCWIESQAELGYYNFERSFSCPESCEDSSEMQVACGNACSDKVFCAKKNNFKCTSQKCGRR